MKKIISNLALIASISLLVPCYSTAQKLAASSYAPDSPSGEGIPTVNPDSNENPGKATIKVLKANLKAAKVNRRWSDHFNSNYKGATDVKWVIEEDAIVVAFKIG